MKELPEPEGQLAWQTYTRDQVLAIQKQAYEDGLRDAENLSNGLEQTMKWHMKEGSGVSTHSDFPGAVVMNASLYDLLMDSHEALTASQKEQQ